MLKPKVLTNVLHEVNTDQVTCAMLFNKEGSLLAYSGVNDGKSTADVNAALISNIWDTFERQGKDDLVHTMIQCENGNIAVTSVSGMLLALKANSSVPLGMLKAKLIALTTYLEPHLLTVAKDSKF
uniref:Ragulator complex protein LAMTOR2 homolog n=1 Tax=Steinernema glaseri TaxID=37863 RepID=A0A1I7YAH7_9BILA